MNALMILFSLQHRDKPLCYGLAVTGSFITQTFTSGKKAKRYIRAFMPFSGPHKIRGRTKNLNQYISPFRFIPGRAFLSWGCQLFKGWQPLSV